MLRVHQVYRFLQRWRFYQTVIDKQKIGRFLGAIANTSDLNNDDISKFELKLLNNAYNNSTYMDENAYLAHNFELQRSITFV